MPVASQVIKVAVGIPLKGHTPPKSYNDRMLMAFNLGIKQAEAAAKNESPRYEFYWFFVGEIFVPFAREHLANMAIAHECEYLFFVDDDMLAPFDLFFKLVRHDRDIVSALAFTRNPPYRPVIYSVREGWDSVTQSRYYTNQSVLNYPRDSLVQCDAVGFGAVLINTRVLKELPQPWFMSSAATGEDVLFCCKAKEAGFKIFCDTSVKLGHLSDGMVITEEYSDGYNKLNESDREALYGKYQRFETLEATK